MNRVNDPPHNPHPNWPDGGPEAVWQAALGDLQLQMPRSTFDQWLRESSFVAYENDTFVIGVPTAFAKDWLENRLRRPITSTLQALTQRPVNFSVVVRPKTHERRSHAGPLLGVADDEANAYSRAAYPTSANDGSLPLDPALTFDTFIVGSSNRMAHAAAQAAAENPGQRYNPLFLWGGVGLGKTHLLQAVGHVGRKRGQKVVYVSSEAFTNDLIKAIRAQATEAFRDKYRTADFLLIDDIQFIAGKESTQEEFFHTFNALHGARKQIVLTSDRPPKSLSTLEERLRSRFEGGLIADLQPPDFEMRLAILRSRSEMMEVGIPNDILMYVAERIQSNVRELTGALNRIVMQAQVLGKAPSMDVARMVLEDLAPQRSSKASPEAIATMVAEEFGVTLEALQKQGRSKTLVIPRQVAMYLLREVTDLSLPQIGEVLGGRDHTTIMHGIQKIGNQMETDTALRRRILALKERIFAPSS